MSMRRHMMLVEALRLQTLILENRMEFLTKTFLPKLEAMIHEPHRDHLIRLPDMIAQHIPAFRAFHDLWIAQLSRPLYAQPTNVENPKATGPNAKFKALLQQVATEFLTYIVQLDPDPLKKNVQWLLTLITRKQQPMPVEDLIYAGESLTKFMQMKKERLIPKEKSDINKYKSLSDLNHALRGEQDNRQAVATTKDAEMRAQSNIIYDGPDYSVISPQTKAAAGYFGRNTEWCTAWGCPEGRHPTRGDNYFDQYNKQGPLYIITDKSTGELWQFSFASGQFMDVDDRSVNLDAFFKQHPKVEQVFENMDGEPIATISMGDDTRVSVPVYALGKGFVIKSKKGPRGAILLQANVAPDGSLMSDMTGFWILNAQPGQPKEIASLMNKLHITGDEDGVAQLGLYYRDGKWGTLSEVAKPFLRVGYLEWRQVNTKQGRELVLGVSHDDMLRDVADDFGEGLLTGTLFDGAMGLYPTDALSSYENKEENRTFRSRVDELGASLSRAVADMLLKEPDAKKWDDDSKIKSSSLTDEDAKRLILVKPGFGDLVSAYKIHGNTKIVKSMVEDWCEGMDLSIGKGMNKERAPWIGDDLIIEWFKDAQELVEELGNDTAKWVNKLVNGEDNIEHYDVTADHHQVSDLVDSLEPDVLTRLGEFLQAEHPDEAEEIEDYDPSDAGSIMDLFRDTNDNDLQQAANWAVQDGLQIGAENEASEIYAKTLENNDYVVFLDDKGQPANKMTYDSPCCFVVPLKKFIEYVKSEGEEQAAYNLSDGWTEVFDDAKIDIDQGRYGFDGYDDDAAQERFNDSVHEFLPEDATA
jgi:hypothetical protein